MKAQLLKQHPPELKSRQQAPVGFFDPFGLTKVRLCLVLSFAGSLSGLRHGSRAPGLKFSLRQNRHPSRNFHDPKVLKATSSLNPLSFGTTNPQASIPSTLIQLRPAQR